MSVEWQVQLRCMISVDNLLAATSDVLANILKGSGETLVLEVETTGQGVSRLTGDDSRYLSSGESVAFKRAGSGDGAIVDVLDVGIPDDQEGGIWLTASSFRTDVSMLISMSVAIAAARLSGGTIIDEPGLLGQRELTAAQAFQRLRQVDLMHANTVEECASLIVSSLL